MNTNNCVKGILAPSDMEICGPLLKNLKDDFGIEMIEKTV